MKTSSGNSKKDRRVNKSQREMVERLKADMLCIDIEVFGGDFAWIINHVEENLVSPVEFSRIFEFRVDIEMYPLEVEILVERISLNDLNELIHEIRPFLADLCENICLE